MDLFGVGGDDVAASAATGATAARSRDHDADLEGLDFSATPTAQPAGPPKPAAMRADPKAAAISGIHYLASTAQAASPVAGKPADDDDILNADMWK